MVQGNLKLTMSCSNRFSSTATAHFLNAIITDDFQRCVNHPNTLQTWLMRKHTKLAVLPLHKKPYMKPVIRLTRTYTGSVEKRCGNFLNPSLTPTFAYFLQSPYFPRFSYGLCVLQILFFLYGECFKFNLSHICFACFEGLLHWRISMFSPNGFFPFVVTSFWVLIRRTISVQ